VIESQDNNIKLFEDSELSDLIIQLFILHESPNKRYIDLLAIMIDVANQSQKMASEFLKCKVLVKLKERIKQTIRIYKKNKSLIPHFNKYTYYDDDLTKEEQQQSKMLKEVFASEIKLVGALFNADNKEYFKDLFDFKESELLLQLEEYGIDPVIISSICFFSLRILSKVGMLLQQAQKNKLKLLSNEDQ